MGTDKQRGGGNLAQQMASLESRMTEDQIATATKIAEKQPEVVIRYAVKLIAKSKPNFGGLSKREQAEYENMKHLPVANAIEVAEAYKADKLASKKNKSKKSKS